MVRIRPASYDAEHDRLVWKITYKAGREYILRVALPKLTGVSPNWRSPIEVVSFLDDISLVLTVTFYFLSLKVQFSAPFSASGLRVNINLNMDCPTYPPTQTIFSLTNILQRRFDTSNARRSHFYHGFVTKPRMAITSFYDVFSKWICEAKASSALPR